MHLIDSQLLLCRRQCEERRQYRSELERLAQRLRADCARLCAQSEQAVSDSDHSASAALIERHGKLERSLAAIDEQIVAAGVALAAAEQELLRRERPFAPRAGDAPPPDRARGRLLRPERRAGNGRPLPPAGDRR